MLSEIPYASFLNYSKEGSEQVRKWSRDFSGALKNAEKEEIRYAINHPKFQKSLGLFSPFLNTNTILVPIPGSRKFQSNSIWPSLAICEILKEKGLGNQILKLLTRKITVRSSSKGNKDERLSIEEHINSMELHPEFLNLSDITLVDDVVSAGRTSMACGQMLNEAYPNVTIRLFTLMKTKSGENDLFVQPYSNKIHYYESGKTFRKD